MEFCRKAVRRADIFVGLVGLRRGWEPAAGNEKRSITEMEHDWARDADRPRYIWVTPDDFPVPGTLHESDGQFARQQAFRKRVMAGGERIVSRKGFESAELLAGKIVKQLLLSDVTEELLNSFKLEPRRRASPSLRRRSKRQPLRPPSGASPRTGTWTSWRSLKTHKAST